MTDEIKDATGGFLGRINHPVIGAFITSVLVWNWEILYYMFRGLSTAQATVNLLHREYLTLDNWFNLFFVPLLITILFLGVAPWLHELYDSWKEWTHSNMEKFSPKPKYEFDNFKKQYDLDLKTLKGEKEVKEREYARIISSERESTSRKIESLERDLKASQETRRIQVNYSPYPGTPGNFDLYQTIKDRDKYLTELNAEKEANRELVTKNENLTNEIDELKILLEIKKKK